MVPRKTCNRILPQPLVRWLRELRFAALDTLDRWCGRADDLTPPRSLQHFVGGAYQALGEAFFSHFQNLCHLRPDQSVLDVGCGSGRMAVPLLGYLDQRGRYVGFDISPKLIRWCSGHISRRNANFTFHLADIYNRHYNPRGACRASEYRFPCEDRTIDFVFATSVFTHMLADDTRHYLHEIRRVLKPGGHGLLTHFILNAESEAAMNRSPEGRKFRFPLQDCFTMDAEVPERGVAFAETTLRQMYAEADLRIEEPIRFGKWSGRPGGLSYQDIVLVGPCGWLSKAASRGPRQS